jgi:hypothetical protein
MMGNSIPDCPKCKNYFITHDPGRPYGCRAMAFKSRINPARLVYESSGIGCQLFIPKKTGKKISGGKKFA